MKFIDKATISITAGNGGDGGMSFRHEKFVDKGGPDGGDGGNGGSVILVADRNENTLAYFRYQKELKAEHGRPGTKSRKHGRGAPDLLVPVPVGTMVVSPEGELLVDLTEDTQQAVIAKGGRGGFGNAHFVSSVRQAPKFAEKGEEGESRTVTLELKMIADVGVIGLPNAGKSTLLSRISNARPEIADYPFTTLTPNIGVVDIDSHSSLLFADIPGLIEGAAAGKGLGHEFLRHVERTSVLVHLIDAYQDDVVAAYETIQAELTAHAKELVNKPQVVAINKVEGLDKEMVNDLLGRLRKVVPKGTELFAISTMSAQGLKELLFAIKTIVDVAKQHAAEVAEQEGVPVLRLNDTEKAWKVTKEKDYYLVTGNRIEKFAGRTDFDNEQGVRRLRDIMKRMGIMHELLRQGLGADDKVVIGKPNQMFEY